MTHVLEIDWQYEEVECSCGWKPNLAAQLLDPFPTDGQQATEHLAEAALLARRGGDLGADYLEMQRLHIQLGDEMGEVRESLAWALDLIDRYDQHLIDRGNPADTVLTPFHVAEKAKARRALLARRAPGDRERALDRVLRENGDLGGLVADLAEQYRPR